MSRHAFVFACTVSALVPSSMLFAAGSVGSPTEVAAAEITAARLDNADLRVTLDLATSGSVELLDAQGGLIASAPFGGVGSTLVADSSTGRREAVFVAILPRLLSGSPLYSLRLAVPDGRIGTQPQWPFALSLACGAAKCRPHLLPGVAPGPGTRWASTELGAFFDSAAPGEPVLEAAMAAGLIGPALDFARVLAAEPTPAPGTCQCTFDFETTPPKPDVCGTGLRIGVGAQGVSGERRIEARRVHHFEMQLPLRCFSRSGLSGYPVLVESGTWQGSIEVPVPALLPCTRPCSTGNPNFQVAATARLQLTAAGADGTSTVDGSWRIEVGPAVGLPTSAGEQRELVGGSPAIDSQQAVTWAGGASHLDVQVELTAGLSLPGKVQSGAASSEVDLEVMAEAVSLCGDVSRGSGTVRIAPGSPPSMFPQVLDPTQISILIEGGCRP